MSSTIPRRLDETCTAPRSRDNHSGWVDRVVAGLCTRGLPVGR